MDLLNEYGPLGYTIYDFCLQYIYENGYYIDVPRHQLVLMLIKDIGAKWVKNKDLVWQVIDYCAEIGLFDNALLQQNIMTSVGIQRRYDLATVRNKVDKTKHWLLDDFQKQKSEVVNITVSKNPDFATETPETATETPETATETPHIKKAIRGRVFEMYLTENLDKVRAYIGRGKWGHGKPDRPLRHRRLMEKFERKDAEMLLSALAGNLMALAKIKSPVEDQYKDFWQKDLCMCWDDVHGCTAGESDCDSCTSFRRIPVQYCKRCGKDFYEQKSNYFCNDCRRARLKQAQRKYAIMSNRKR